MRVGPRLGSEELQRNYLSSGIRDDARGMQNECVFDPVQHRVHGPDFDLPDRHRGLNINDNRMVSTDQIVGRIGKERWAFTGGDPLACWIGMRCELRLQLRGCSECSTWCI